MHRINMVNERFGAEARLCKRHFSADWVDDAFELKPDFDTQRKVEHYFIQLAQNLTSTIL